MRKRKKRTMSCNFCCQGHVKCLQDISMYSVTPTLLIADWASDHLRRSA